MFKRYGELMVRMEELGARAGQLCNSDRQELQSLLEEQAWLSSTMIKKAKSVLEEIDGAFEKLFDWMIDISALIERAAGEEGTPEDLLALEKVMADAVSLRDQMKRLNPDNCVARTGKKQGMSSVPEVRLEAAPAAAPLCTGSQEPKVAFAGIEAGASSPVDNPAGSGEIPVKPQAVPVSFEHPVARESLAVVPAKSGEAPQKKTRKKKAKKVKSLADGQYRPPRELLASMAEKMAAEHRRKYQPGLPENMERMFTFNLPDLNNNR